MTLLAAIDHVVHGGVYLFVRAIHTATPGNHAGARNTVDTAGVQRLYTFLHARGPGVSVSQHGSTRGASGMTGHAGRVVDIFTRTGCCDLGLGRSTGTTGVASGTGLAVGLDARLNFRTLGFGQVYRKRQRRQQGEDQGCLLYTSDAADE